MHTLQDITSISDIHVCIYVYIYSIYRACRYIYIYIVYIHTHSVYNIYIVLYSIWLCQYAPRHFPTGHRRMDAARAAAQLRVAPSCAQRSRRAGCGRARRLEVRSSCESKSLVPIGTHNIP